MSDYDEYLEQCEKVKEENAKYLALFEKDLQEAGLSPKTISNHVSNVEFYINEYLLYEEPRPMEDGAYALDSFLGYWFIRKCMWSTPASIKSNAASMKKFYKCMLTHGKVSKDAYDQLCSDIKENMEQWQEDCAQYNDMDAPNPFAWF